MSVVSAQLPQLRADRATVIAAALLAGVAVLASLAGFHGALTELVHRWKPWLYSSCVDQRCTNSVNAP